MKLSLLKNFFSNDAPIIPTIKTEVAYYTKQSLKKGSTMPVIVTEDIDLFVESKDISKLCRAYIDGNFSEHYIYYLSDIMTMSERVTFESEELQELVVTLTDPEINGELTLEIALDVIDILEK